MQKEKTSKNKKAIMFRDILDCYLPKESTGNLPKDWLWQFCVVCSNRTFTFTTKTQDERNMWMAGFRYLIVSTVAVQKIMLENNQRYEQKMKKETDKFIMKNTKSQNRNKIMKQEINFTTCEPPEQPKLLSTREDDTAVPVARKNRRIIAERVSQTNENAYQDDKVSL